MDWDYIAIFALDSGFEPEFLSGLFANSMVGWFNRFG